MKKDERAYLKKLNKQDPDELDKACVSEFCNWISEQNNDLIDDLIQYAKKSHGFKPETSLYLAITAVHADHENQSLRTIARLCELTKRTGDFNRYAEAMEFEGSKGALRERLNGRQAARIIGMPERTFRHKVSEEGLGEILGRSKEPGKAPTYDTARVADYALQQAIK